ncbi:hypothetical protein GKE82_07695 [Conexibacter sp. W3-3-2]|uniref:Phage holin family protein n=1 Tax=Paraconexibacter algicola TaxID=2133960 RepID=A0A2T4UFP6_9ACTN|nr:MULTISPECIES: phage holin family protein [Solirubrobacterales]MTD44187.1 hypothetical protein [Conexibacter sp. W3-3-2]PTL56609.1 hypothetical protein C7Y72_16815 [Paraconexibacter algicola]
MADQQPQQSTAQIAQAIQEVTEKAQILVREEIELAKAEVTQKVTKLGRGAVIGVAAGSFALVGLMVLIQGLAWLLYYLLPVADLAYFWGFFTLAAIFFLLAGVAGFLAAKLVKAGKDPKPTMAIEEAKLIKETFENAGSKDEVGS